MILSFAEKSSIKAGIKINALLMDESSPAGKTWEENEGKCPRKSFKSWKGVFVYIQLGLCCDNLFSLSIKYNIVSLTIALIKII